MSTIINKIKNSIEESLNITCLYGSEGAINQKLDYSNYPLAFFTELNTGYVDSVNSHFREKANVAIFFVEPTKFDYGSLENEELIEECRTLALAWVDKTKLDKDLTVIVNSTARVYNINDSILTGFAINCEITENVGLSCLNRYSMRNLLIENLLKETGYAVYYNVAESTPSIVYNIVGNRLKLDITLEEGDTIDSLYKLIKLYFEQAGVQIKTLSINGSESWYEIILLYKIVNDSIIPGQDVSIDLSMYDILGQLQQTRETANCYVISEPGDYCIPLVYGNAIKGGLTNSLSFTNQGSSFGSNFVNYLGNSITSPYIEIDTGIQAKSAEVLMSDENRVIRNPRITSRKDEVTRFLRFRVTQVPETGANVVVGIKDINGNIMWSWHMWLWKDSLAPITITNHDNITYGILPVNLGSKYDDTTTYEVEPKRHMKNWLYQWGRKDPMLCPGQYYYESTPSNHDNYGSLNYSVSTTSISNASNTIKNPSTFYTQGLSSSNYYNYWDATNNTKGFNSKVVVKTVYDPCPRGYNVPGTNVFTGFVTNGESGAGEGRNIVGEFANGYYCKANSEDTNGIFFPAAGDRVYSNGTLEFVGIEGNYWTAGFDIIPNTGVENSYGATYMEMNTRRIDTESETYKTYAYSIRPCSEVAVPVYTVTTTTSGNGTVTGGGDFFDGTTCTLTAIEDTHYDFVRWTVNGVEVSTNSTYSFTVTSNITVTAVFELEKHTITTATVGTGTVTGAGDYSYGTTCTLTASEGTGYDFAKWTVNGVQVSTDNPYSFTVTEDLTVTAVFTKESYTVTATTTGQGSVSGDGNFEFEDTCTLTATPSTGYDFTSWTVNNVEVSTDNPYAFTVTEDVTVNAIFTAKTYTVTTSTSGSGTVSGGGDYSYGSTCTLTATEGTGYIFARWTVNGVEVSTSSTYSFTVEDDVTITAVFIPAPYTINATSNGNGSVSGGGVYLYGSTCTLTATPDTGYEFDEWRGTISHISYDNPYSFTVAGNQTIIGYFKTATYTVTTNTVGSGTVSGGGDYSYGSTCTLTATPSTGYEFSNWKINGSTVSLQSTYSFTVEDNVTITATFTAINYTVTATSSGNGSVSGGGSYAYGTTCTITASPNAHYEIDKWQVNGSDVPGPATNTYSFTVTGNTTVNAVFKLETFEITTSVSSSGGTGTVTGGGTYSYGDTCTITATPTYNYYEFNSYSINIGGSISTSYTNPYSFTVESDMSIEALFTLKQYTVTTTNDGNGSVSGGGSYYYNSTCTLTATPGTGYEFDEWTVSGSQVSTSNPYSFTVTEDVTVNANFKVPTYTVTISSVTGGSVTGAGTYSYGDTVTITATPDTGYEFVSFDVNGSTISQNPYSFTITSNVTVVPSFELLPPDYLTITSLDDNNRVGIVRSSGGTYSLDMEYTTDDITWQPLAVNDYITLNANEFVRFRGNNMIHGFCQPMNENSYGNYISAGNYGKRVVISGNIMSLIDKTCTSTTIPIRECFKGLFMYANINGDCDLSGIKLPATTLTNLCYKEMFWNIRGTITALPSLPATTLALGCYQRMFYNSPIGSSVSFNNYLPATTLANYCYKEMFSNCSYQGYGPDYILDITLPATTLANYCYQGMFAYNDFLRLSANMLPATTLAEGCYRGMFSSCQNLRAIPSGFLPATTLAKNCYSSMFSSCRYYLNNLPIDLLPATTLAEGCYRAMFYDNMNLGSNNGTIPSLPATTLAQDCYNQMFKDTRISSITLPATTLAQDCYYGMLCLDSRLTSITVSFDSWTDANNNAFTTDWVRSVAESGTFYCPSTLPDIYGDNNIPTGWTRVDLT